MIRVLIVGDEPLMRAGIRSILDPQPDLTVLGEAGSGQEAAELAARQRPDVVLLDPRLPDTDGVSAARRIAGLGPHVLMFAADDALVFSALRAGVGGFLLKDCQPQELVQAVRVVAQGESFLTPRVTTHLVQHLLSAPLPRPAPASLDALTHREREVLRHVALGMSNREIGQALFISEMTAKTHVSRVLVKLGLRDRSRAVVLGYESGLVVVNPVPAATASRS